MTQAWVDSWRWPVFISFSFHLITNVSKARCSEHATKLLTLSRPVTMLPKMFRTCNQVTYIEQARDDAAQDVQNMQPSYLH